MWYNQCQQMYKIHFNNYPRMKSFTSGFCFTDHLYPCQASTAAKRNSLALPVVSPSLDCLGGCIASTVCDQLNQPLDQVSTCVSQQVWVSVSSVRVNAYAGTCVDAGMQSQDREEGQAFWQQYVFQLSLSQLGNGAL